MDGVWVAPFGPWGTRAEDPFRGLRAGPVRSSPFFFLNSQKHRESFKPFPWACAPTIRINEWANQLPLVLSFLKQNQETKLATWAKGYYQERET